MDFVNPKGTAEIEVFVRRDVGGYVQAQFLCRSSRDLLWTDSLTEAWAFIRSDIEEEILGKATTEEEV